MAQLRPTGDGRSGNKKPFGMASRSGSRRLRSNGRGSSQLAELGELQQETGKGSELPTWDS
jgi:hypothetical protein